jgi:multimeric flavodoxin WrbA
MNAVLLDGSPAGDERSTRAADSLERELQSRGYEVRRFVVRDLDIRTCTGCFGCWLKTPGECVITNDDAHTIAAAVMPADVFAIVCPAAFGTYGSLAKRVLDRLICQVLPYFRFVDGEVHHSQRYAHQPSIVARGTLAEPDADDSQLFIELVGRHAINMDAPSHAARVIADDSPADGAAAALLDTAGVRAGVLR